MDGTGAVAVRGYGTVRWAVAGVCAVAAALAVPAPAYAHSRLEGSAPAAGATLATAPTEITLTFNETVRGRFSTVVVTGPDARGYADGPVRVVDAVVHQPLHPVRSGGYTVAWRVVSADGHPVQGSFGFTVTLPVGREPAGPPPAAPAAAPGRATGTAWAAVAGGALLVLAAGLLLPTRRRVRKMKR